MNSINSEYTKKRLTLIDELLLKARDAQRIYKSLSQTNVDYIIRAIGKYIYDNAEFVLHIDYVATDCIFTMYSLYDEQWIKRLNLTNVIILLL